jgi:energy-coupling factor transporter transmembrane protein EcfT
MKQPLVIKYVLPFIQWYALMIFIAIVIDYFLHRLGLVFIGRYLGFIGTTVIVVSFVYSLRKRKIITSGSPKKLLELHEYLAWAGSILLLVHAGIHFNAVLPWLAIFMLLITVASGLVGKFLLKKSNDRLKEKKQELISTGRSVDEADKKLFFDSITVNLMKKWRDVHMPINLLLAVLVLIHIVSVVMFSK